MEKHIRRVLVVSLNLGYQLIWFVSGATASNNSCAPYCACSLSNHEAVVALSLVVLIANQIVTSISNCLPFNLQQRLQVAERLHLRLVVFRVFLDLTLVRAQISNNYLLLVQFGVEELDVTFEVSRQTFVGIAHKVGFVLHTLLERF